MSPPPATLADFPSLRAGLANAGMELSQGKLWGGSPPDFRQKEPLVDADVSIAPADGLVVNVGAPVRSDSFVRDHMRDAQAVMGMPKFAQQISIAKDKETATLIAGTA